jgi:hypothetical protein
MLGKTAIILGSAYVGWSLSGLIMAAGMSLLTPANALAAHAIGAPIVFAAVAWVYFRYFGYTTPLQTAGLFLAVVVFMNVLVVALLVQQSFAMFASFVGTWVPLALIFAATYLTGRFMSGEHA